MLNMVLRIITAETKRCLLLISEKAFLHRPDRESFAPESRGTLEFVDNSHDHHIEDNDDTGVGGRGDFTNSGYIR